MSARPLDAEVQIRAEALFSEVAMRLRTTLLRRCGEISVLTGSVRPARKEDLPTLPGLLDTSYVGGASASVDRSLIHRLVGRVLGSVGPDLEGAERVLTPLDRRFTHRFLAEVGEALGTLGGDRKPFSTEGWATGWVEGVLSVGGDADPWGEVRIRVPLVHLISTVPPTQRTVSLERVMPLAVDVRVELARIKLPLGKVRDLQVGSVIELGRPREVKVTVGGRPTFLAEPGEQEGWRCIRVLSRLT